MKYCPLCGVAYPDGTKHCPEDGGTLMSSMARPDPLVGKRLKDAYLIEERLASGGMGAIYRATQITLQRPVAVKTLLPHLQNSQQIVQRFFREAKILSQLNHPGIVSILEFGNTEEGMLYLVMEFLDGKTLEDVTPPDRGLSPDTAILLMEETCRAVEAAHHAGLIHRDLKPSNIFLSRVSGGGVVVKILDFGISKLVVEGMSNLTQQGQVMGTPGYMSPEMIMSNPVIDGRADVYALGGILYYMLSARSPYAGASVQEIITKQVRTNAVEIDYDALSKSDARPLDPVIRKAMSYDSADRYATPMDFFEAIRTAMNWQGVPDASLLKNALLPARVGNTPVHLRAPGDVGSGARWAPPSGAPRLGSGSYQPESGEEKTNFTPSHGAPPPGYESPRVAASSPPSDSAIVLSATQSHRKRGIAMLAGVAATVLAVGFFAGRLGGPPPESASAVVIPPTAPTAIAPAVRGVTPDGILLGMSAPFSGMSKEVGRRVQFGLEAGFERVNAAGGVHGRKLTLVALDDGSDPARALANTKALVEERGVFAIVGNVGEAAATLTAPYAVAKKVLFFAPYTGGDAVRRDPPDRYVFNYRASFEQEAHEMVHFLMTRRDIEPDEIAVFAQGDENGDSGFQGVARALREAGFDSDAILRTGHDREGAEVAAAVQATLAARKKVKAVILITTYRPAVRFIRALQDAEYHPIFMIASFVGGQSLADEFVESGAEHAEGVIVTQVVPSPDSNASGVIRYREDLARVHPEERPGFASLEGYAAAEIFVEALERAGPEPTTEKMVDALEAMRGFDPGLGTSMDFGASDHQASDKVWGTVLDKDAKYAVLDLE